MAKEKTYSEKLKDPRWQRRRLDILSRDEFTCQKCGDKENTLHVHHRWYKAGKEPWEYPDEILITLCESCHIDEEEHKSEQWFLIKSFLVCGNFNTELHQISEDLIYAQSELGLQCFRQLISHIRHDIDFRQKINALVAEIGKSKP